MSADKNGWRPIETAPKDGAIFLVWFPEQREIGYGNFVPADYAYPDAYYYFWFDVSEAEMEVSPTHWQPLPKPPVTP